MPDTYRHFPETFDPIALTVGSYALYWYAVMFGLGLLASGFLFLRRRAVRDPGAGEEAVDLALLLALGAVLGGRIGFVLLYAPGAFLAEPWLVFWPAVSGQWAGLSGMSFFGGTVGVTVALFFWCRWKKKGFWDAADDLAWAAPVGLFFGRLGNFLNLELPGRPTDWPWGLAWEGMAGPLRHPVTLYEAAGEGLVLWWILSKLSKSGRLAPGQLAGAFLIGYGLIRFWLEFFREPDTGFGLYIGYFTYNQGLAVLAIIAGGVLFHWRRGSGNGILPVRKIG